MLVKSSWIYVQDEQEVNANPMISYHSDPVVTLRERRRSGRLRKLFFFYCLGHRLDSRGTVFRFLAVTSYASISPPPHSAQTAQRLVVIGGDFSQWVERLGRESDHPRPSVVGVDEWSCASPCP